MTVAFKRRLQDLRVHFRAFLCGNILALGLVSFFTDVASEMIYPLLPVFFTGLMPLGTAAVYVGLMDGLAESASSFTKILSGHGSDRLRKRKILVLMGYGISTFFRPLTAFATVGWHVVGLRFIDRIGKGVRTAPRDALLSESVSPEYRGTAFGFHRGMDHAGAVLGPVLALFILFLFLGRGLWIGQEAQASAEEMTALRWLFGIALLPGLAALLAIALGVRETYEAQPAQSPDSADESDSGSMPGRFYLFLGIVTLFALGNSSDLFIVFYAKTEFGLGLGGVTLLWIGLHIVKMVFSVPGGLLADRYGHERTILAGWLLYAFVYAGLAFAAQFWHVCFLLVAYGAYYGLTEGAERALIAASAPQRVRGRAFGFYHGAIGLAALPASLLFGVFWMQLGATRAFLIGSAIAGCAAILLALYRLRYADALAESRG